MQKIDRLCLSIYTVTFEISDQNLERERSNGIEFSLQQNLRRVRINDSFFDYGIKDFVYLAPQDEDGDGSIDVEDINLQSVYPIPHC